MLSLLDHGIWWHVYPLGAVGAPIRGHDGSDHAHRLPRLEAWLDYVVELGCNGLLLGPVFASTAHGYDTIDHFRIDPRLGDDADWDHLVAAARSRGIVIMLDGVFNHVGIDHPLVAAAREGGGLIRMVDGQPAPWEGHGDLAELDHADPRVADLVTDVMLHWLRRGAAGWRLDVAYAVPAPFWAEVTARVRREFPDALFLGEVIHGDYPEFIAASHLDTVTQYELWKAIWSSIAERNLWELAWALERHDAFGRSFVPQTFVGNHDVTRIASQVGGDGAAVAAAILLTLPGMPSIYYGDEQAFRGEKGEHEWADDPMRPPLPETPEQMPSFGAWLHTIHQQLIALRRRNPWIVRARVTVVDKTNESIHYRVHDDDHALDVRIGLDPVSVEARVQGAPEGFVYEA